MFKQFVRGHTLSVALIFYLFLYSLVLVYKPAFLYNTDGSLRQFGLGFRRKTVVPIWLFSIVLAIVAYFLVLTYERATPFLA